MTTQELNTEFVEVKDAAYRYAFGLLHNRVEAEDLVQDLYEKLWRRRLFVRKRGFVQLVMVSVRNMCMDILRVRQRVWRDDGVYREEEIEKEFLWENEKEREDIAGIVGRLVEHLPQKEREVFHLRVVESLDYADVAKILDMNESAVRMACSRAKGKIKDELTKIMSYGVEREKGR